MGSQLDCINSSQLREQMSMEKINEGKKMYALTNRISRFPLLAQEAIERMFVLNQIHICDRIVELHNNRRKEDADKLLKDLNMFDCEQFDELFHLCSVKTHSPQIPYPRNKISSKLKACGQEVLSEAKIAFIIPVECFWHEDVLKESELLSRKSKLQLYLEKIEAFSNRYRREDDTVVSYLIAPSSEMTKLLRFAHPRVRLITYESTFPCFNHLGKIALFGSNVEFSEKSGDLMHFIRQNQTLSEIPTKFDYICFNNIHNLVGPVIEPEYIGWLHSEQAKHMVATVRNPKPIWVSKNFIEIGEDNEFGLFLMKSSFIQTIYSRQDNHYQLFSKQIKMQRVEGEEDKLYFVRTPAEIMYGPMCAVAVAKEWADSRTAHSNYCKKMLGISPENEEDNVEICPQILYGKSEKIVQLRQRLENSDEALGFPLIVMKMQ